MNNFDVARNALDTSLKSSGSALREHEKASQSLEFKLNSLKATWQSLSQTFMDSDFLKGGVDALTKFVDVIDTVIDRFGILGTAAGGISLYKIFKNGFAFDEDGNKIGTYFDLFKGTGKTLKSTGSAIKDIITSSGTLSEKLRLIGLTGERAGQDIVKSFKDSKSALSAMAKDIAKVVVIMNAIKAVQDIISWISEAGEEAETTAEKFDRISDELSDAESELTSLESELSSVESQIDALLEKDELTFADEEELSRLREVSAELEHQIQLAETLQESLNKSLSATAIDAYGEYASATSFYSAKSKQERKEEANALGNSIGNIVGLLAGGIIGSFVGQPMLGAAIGSTIGSFGGGLLGGAISNSYYDNETTVSEMLDRMHLERTKLKRALNEADEIYSNDPTNANAEAYEEARTALNDYNTALAEHIAKISEYYNSIDYNTLETKKEKDEYIAMGDILDAYNIEMGVKGAKTAALDRIFSEELVTDSAENLKLAIQNALDAGGEVNFEAFNTKEHEEAINRFADMGITITEVISYLRELEEVQAEAFDYDTYDIVSNIATLSDGVAALTDAFVEFNEQGVISAKTLSELHEVFGSLDSDWTNYVDTMSNGISSIEDAREATEQLAEAHLNNTFSNGGIKFAKFNEESGKYEFDADNYKTYLSTISELENLGVANAKEYIDASQQRAMIKEAVAQMRNDSAQKQALLAKETLNKEEEILLNKLKSRDINYYIQDIEDSYNVPLKDTSILEKEYDLNEYNSILEDRKDALSEMTEYFESYEAQEEIIGSAYDKYLEANEKAKALEDELIEDSLDRNQNFNGGFYMPSWNDFEGIDDFLGTDFFDTDWDDLDEASEDASNYFSNYEDELAKQEKMFNDMVDIAKEMDIDLSDIIDVDNFEFDATADNAKEVFKQVYDRVKSELEISVEEYEKLADDLSSEIEAAYENLGLDIDFGRYFDKIVMDGFNTKVEQINTARAEMLSTGGLSTDSIMAIDKIFGDLNSYDSSKLFENTLNGVRLNTEEFRRLNNEFKNTNIDGLENKMSDLGDQYIKTREELYNLTYGTEEYNAKARELADIEAEIAANEELMSSYQGLFSAFQEWQRAESAGAERGMYETILGGFETVGDEISRGWIDDGTREFLELLKGDTVEIVNADGTRKEINLATASAKELQQVWKGLDKDIEHTSYSVRDFFTVDDEGNSTSQGVYNFLDAIGQLEEEKFDYKDVVKRDDNDNIIGFDFQIVGGDKAIAEALGISEELVQIMKRAAIDAGFVVNFDGSYESLDVLREKAENAAKTMNEKLKEAGKATIDIDMNADSVEDIQSQLDKIMETFGEKDGNGKLTGAINMDIEGADEAIQVASTLQSMMDKLTRPAYMDIQISQVDEELRVPLQNLQDYRTKIEQLNQQKLRGADTTELEASIEESKEKIIADLIEIQESNPKLAAELEIDGLSKEEIEKKVETGEIKIPATVDIQLEMAESLDILALTALKDNGLISDEEYVKRVNVYLDAEVNNGDAKEETENAVDEVTDGETRKQNVEIIAETFGVEDVDELSSKLKGLDDKTIQAIAEVLGQVDVNSLKLALSGMSDVQVQAIAEAIGKGDVEGLQAVISGLDGNTVQAIAQAFGYDDVNQLNTAIENLDPKVVQAIAQALGLGDVNTLQTAVNNMQGNEVPAAVNTDGQVDKIGILQSSIFGLTGTTVDVVVNFVKSGFNAVKNWLTGGGGEEGGSSVNGTANVDGTTGRAFKQGSWGTKNSGTALVGELGREVLIRGGRYYTVGDYGAEFIKYKKGDIILNHVQSEQLFKNGKVTAGGGRAKALVNGTAYANGTYPSSGAAFNNYKWDGSGGGIEPEVTSYVVGTNKSTGKTYTKSKDSDSSKDFEETFDLIEIAIKRIEREIDNLDQKANRTYKSWSSRNSALASEISKVGSEINLQSKAYNEYMAAANGVGLSSEWIKKIQNGEVDIETVKDEVLAEKIKDYQSYYEQALECKDAIEDLKDTEAELYRQRFQNIQAQYDGILQGYEHTETMLNEYINQAEAQGHIVSKKYYDALISNEKSNIAQLKKEQAALIKSRDEAVASGKIAKNSEEWISMCNEIDSVTQAIEESTTALLEFDNAMREIDWSVFDLKMQGISDVNDEVDFLIDLMSNDDLYDDKGKLTGQGVATLGLLGQKHNVNMYSADEYGKEVAKLDKQIAKDPYDQELINRRRELIELQRESILEAENEKQAIKDLVSDGIDKELDALSELIDKKNESLDTEKELYKYQKKVQEQTENIGNLRKQLAAYEGDNSQEAAAKAQELRVSLAEAETELKETEWDKYISDTSAILDTLYTEYETTLNTRLDNVDYLLQQVIDGINGSATAASEYNASLLASLGAEGTLATALGVEGAIASAIVNVTGENGSIKNILNKEVTGVGITLSNAMNSIWSVGDGNAKSILTTYGTNFQNQQTTTNQTLNGIKVSVDKMVAASNKEATTKTTANKTTTSAKKDPTKTTTTTTTKKPTTTTTKTTSSGDGKAKIGDKVKFVSGKYYYDSQGTKPLGSKYQGKQVYITNINTKNWATHPYHISTGNKLGKGDLGWLKLNQLSGYASGKHNFSNNEWAWTQEGRKEEYIIRPSDGAILTPIARRGSVLNAEASSNLWNMSNSPAEFIKNNLGLDSANIPNSANVQNSYVQNFENITFSMPNVHSYDETIKQMQRDKSFEKLILALTLDQVAGKSSLAKGKSIR